MRFESLGTEEKISFGQITRLLNVVVITKLRKQHKLLTGQLDIFLMSF